MNALVRDLPLPSLSLRVTVSPLALQPDVGRYTTVLPEGMTIAEIVRRVMPGTEAVHDRVRVALVTGDGVWIIQNDRWHLVRPKAGVNVIIRTAPGKQAATLLLTIAAAAIAGWAAPLVAGALFGAGVTAFQIGFTKAVLTLGLTALGGLLISHLFPTEAKKDEKAPFSISGWRNEYLPDSPVPMVLGTHRYAPPFAAFSWLEVVGDILYNRAAFLWGYAPLEIADLKIGETSIDKFDEIEIEELGYGADDTPTIYTQQVVEESIGTDLQRTYARDDEGNMTDDEGSPSEESPVSRFTGRDVTHAIIILSFPSGLVRVDNQSRKNHVEVAFSRRYRIVGTVPWTTIDDLTIRANKQVGFYRSDRIDFPIRGRYEIEYNRLTQSEKHDSNTNEFALACTWVVLQSFRPEYPFNFAKDVAITAMRVKATFQLNGALDTLNGVVKRIAPDWNGSAWLEAVTRNPASLALFCLRGPGLYRATPDDEIDLDAFADWHDFCADKGLKYDRVHDFDASLGETLAAVAAAGRAVVRHDGRRWTVVIDRPRELVVDHINPRNASGIRASASYFEPPHALRVPFLDETNDYQENERIVPWPGHVGDIDITEELRLPGKTDPDEIWIETRRRQYEIMHRSVTYSATQQGAARSATTGDLVMASRDILKRVMHSGRVKAVRGAIVELDEIMTMEEGESYAIRFRQFSEADTVGESIVRTVATVAGETTAIRLTGTGEVPVADDLVHFGPAAQDSIALILAGIERGRNGSSILRLLPAAEIIDELVDAEVPPAWNGRVGDEIASGGVAPAVPIITKVETGLLTTGDPDFVVVLLSPGTGSAVAVATYDVRHRLAGAGVWEAPESGTAAAGSVTLDMYSDGDEIEIAARAVSADAFASAYGATVTVDVGEDGGLDPPEDIVPTLRFAIIGGVMVSYGHATWTTAGAGLSYEVEFMRLDGTGPIGVVAVPVDEVEADLPPQPDDEQLRLRIRTVSAVDVSPFSAWFTIPDVTLRISDPDTIRIADADTYRAV